MQRTRHCNITWDETAYIDAEEDGEKGKGILIGVETIFEEHIESEPDKSRDKGQDSHKISQLGTCDSSINPPSDGHSNNAHPSPEVDQDADG